MVTNPLANVSAVVVPADILFRFGLTATEKLLYAVLISGAAGGKKHVEMQMNVLGLVLGFSDRTIARGLRKLEAAGLVKVEGVKEGRNGGIRVKILQKVAATVSAAVLSFVTFQPAAAKVFEPLETPGNVRVLGNNSMDYATRKRRKRPAGAGSVNSNVLPFASSRALHLGKKTSNDPTGYGVERRIVCDSL